MKEILLKVHCTIFMRAYSVLRFQDRNFPTLRFTAWPFNQTQQALAVFVCYMWHVHCRSIYVLSMNYPIHCLLMFMRTTYIYIYIHHAA